MFLQGAERSSPNSEVNWICWTGNYGKLDWLSLVDFEKNYYFEFMKAVKRSSAHRPNHRHSPANTSARNHTLSHFLNS